MKVEFLSGPEQGETVNALASTLWTPDQLVFARERRGRDLEIAKLNREKPVDPVDWLAIQMCCRFTTGDTVVECMGTAQTMLAQLNRPEELTEIHDLAYADGTGRYASVVAPAGAWRELFEEFAKTQPDLVEQLSATEVGAGGRFRSEQDAAALATLRRWAGLSPIAPALAPSSSLIVVDEPQRAQKSIKQAAAELSSSADSPASELQESYRDYRAAREELDGGELSTMKGWSAQEIIWGFAEQLSQTAEKSAEPLVTWLMNTIGVRGFHCEHIVWSDYSAQHPRVLHLFPDGDSYPEEERWPPREWGPVTVCGEQVFLGWRDRSWSRAQRGEWLEHYEALQRHRANMEQRGERLGTPRWDPDFEEARRICANCANYHGLYLECLESSESSTRWPIWKLAELRKTVEQELIGSLQKNRPAGSVKRARRLALEIWLAAEIAAIAGDVKRRGSAPLRRLFGERASRAPSRYEEWTARCQPVGLEPHELLSESMWRQLLAQSLSLFPERHTVPIGKRREFRDLAATVLEARMSAL